MPDAFWFGLGMMTTGLTTAAIVLLERLWHYHRERQFLKAIKQGWPKEEVGYEDNNTEALGR